MNKTSQLSRKEMLRHTGQLSQLAGATRFVYADGMAKGLPAVRVKNGSGLAFTVLEGRNMDLYDLEYKGINLAFLYKNGLMSSERVTHVSREFLGQSSGGMLYTSGLQNSGPENEAEGLFHPLHGRIGAMAADQISTFAGFDDQDNFLIEVSGQTREARLFKHNLTLNRKISTRMNDNRVVVVDQIENETCRDTKYSILYHINFGYPFLDEGTKIIVSDRTTTTARSDMSKQYFEQRFEMSKPIDNFEEHLYYLDIPADSDGMSHALVVNEALNLAVELRFDKATLPYLVEWKSMNSGDYALGVMPSSSLLRGRREELEQDGLSVVEAFSKVRTGVELLLYDDAKIINERIDSIRAI